MVTWKNKSKCDGASADERVLSRKAQDSAKRIRKMLNLLLLVGCKVKHFS